MNTSDFVKKTKPEIVKSLRIEIDGFADIVELESGEITLYEYGDGGDWAIYLGEFDMWHWIVPLSTMKAHKEDDSIFDRDSVEISVKDMMYIMAINKGDA